MDHRCRRTDPESSDARTTLPEVIAHSVAGAPPQPSRDLPYMDTARMQHTTDSTDSLDTRTNHKWIYLFIQNLCKMLHTGIISFI